MALEPQVPGAMLACSQAAFSPVSAMPELFASNVSFSVTSQNQATLFVGIFRAPLGALAHNYFYKNLLPLLHSLLTSLSSASPILLRGC